MWIKRRKKSLRSIIWIQCNLKETFLKKLGSKIRRFSVYVKHKSLIFVIKKKQKLVNNYMFEIDIKNTRIRCEICSKITTKTPNFFFLLLTFNMYFFAGWLPSFLLSEWFSLFWSFYWNLVYILKLA